MEIRVKTRAAPRRARWTARARNRAAAPPSRCVYRVVTGETGAGEHLLRFFLPVLVGNSLGGLALVAALNHAPA